MASNLVCYFLGQRRIRLKLMRAATLISSTKVSRPYCNICLKYFGTNGSQKAHMKNTHLTEDENFNPLNTFHTNRSGLLYSFNISNIRPIIPVSNTVIKVMYPFSLYIVLNKLISILYN